PKSLKRKKAIHPKDRRAEKHRKRRPVSRPLTDPAVSRLLWLASRPTLGLGWFPARLPPSLTRRHELLAPPQRTVLLGVPRLPSPLPAPRGRRPLPRPARRPPGRGRPAGALPGVARLRGPAPGFD